ALDDSAKEIIKPVLKNNLSYFGIAFFISDSPEEHVKSVTKIIIDKYHKEYGNKGNFLNPKHYGIFKRVCNELGLESAFLDFGIACFISSSDFERADIYFDRDINNNLEKYSVEQMKVLLDGTNNNNQCYWRNRSRNGSDSIKMLQTAKKIMSDGYDFSIYSNLPFDKIDVKLEEDSGEK
ncbi:hypothetical protein MKT61_006740, partial [Providencia rettgeri]|nr:hypothetical protein [Providencia rettgeri]